MESSLLIACDSATTWYAFSYSLSWSNKCEVAELLSDIPFISVGILVFGVSTLFLVIKRVSPSAVSLYFSVLLAFVAVVLDLGRTLANGTAMDTTFVANEPAIKTREVLFALSIGFRLLFYWTYVAEPSRKDPSAMSTRTVPEIKFLTLECAHEPHSGSWMRWGFPGKLLGVGLLVAIIIITTLQIVWRVAPQFHQYSNVYATDAALELLLSFLLLLKLLLNTLSLNTPNNMTVHTFRECLAPISGLLLNIAIGVGNLLYFAFTESTVGRLLQAFEVYIIVVFVVATALLKHRDILLSTASSQRGKPRDVVFTLPEPARGSTFIITPPLIETPRMSTILATAIRNKEPSLSEAFRRSARRSLNHVSSWVSLRISKNRARCEDEETRLWNADKARVDPPYTRNIDTELRASCASSMQGSKEYAEFLRDASVNVNHTSIISALDAQSANVRSVEGSIHNGQVLHPSRADVPQCSMPPQVQASSVTVSSVPSPVRVKHARSMAATSILSPVYGLSGVQSCTGASGSRTSLDELSKQQSQLDRSIEALKLFSARTSPNSSHSNSGTSRKSVELTRSASIGQITVSSEVSLSSFPIPPRLTIPVPSLPSSSPSPVKRIRGSRRVRLAAAKPTPVRDKYSSISPVTSPSLVDVPSPPRFSSIPHSPLGEENESLAAEAKSSCSDSGGTQYNVTSFIGGLATPGEPRQASQEKPLCPAESETSAVAIQVMPVPRRLEGLPASPAAAKLSPLARSSGSRLSRVSEAANVVQYRINDQTSRALLAPPSSHKHVTNLAGKGAAIQDTDPPIAVSAEVTNRVQKTFVRPRPPPLVLRS